MSPSAIATRLTIVAILVSQPAHGAPPPDETGFERLTIPLIAEGKPDPSDVDAIAGYLFRPAEDGKHPAVIMMHGCNGLDWAFLRRAGWVLAKETAARYVAHGYAALVLDSFEPRQVGNACGKPLTVSPERRAWDAFSAARLLGSRADIDKDRLVLSGDSHGGWTVLIALAKGRWTVPERFAAAIAWYPACPATPQGFAAPLLILIGDNDDWTPARPCERLATSLNGTEPETVLRVFPGATHAYDFPLPTRRNFLGYHLAYDAEATRRSWELIDTFLAAHVK